MRQYKKEKQYEIRFKVPAELHDSVKEAAKTYSQSVSSFSRHLFSVAFVDFQKQQEVKHSAGGGGSSETE